jgi:hypothetical protein
LSTLCGGRAFRDNIGRRFAGHSRQPPAPMECRWVKVRIRFECRCSWWASQYSLHHAWQETTRQQRQRREAAGSTHRGEHAAVSSPHQSPQRATDLLLGTAALGDANPLCWMPTLMPSRGGGIVTRIAARTVVAGAAGLWTAPRRTKTVTKTLTTFCHA